MEFIEKEIESTFYYTGTIEKPIVEMTASEREAYYLKAKENVRKRLFAIGQPLVYKKDGVFVAEYANGLIEIVE